MTISAFCPKCKKMLTTKYGPRECCGYSFDDVFKHNQKHPPKDWVKSVARAFETKKENNQT